MMWLHRFPPFLPKQIPADPVQSEGFFFRRATPHKSESKKVGAMPRTGGKRKKTRTHLNKNAPEGAHADGDAEKAAGNVPRSIVAKGGKVGPLVSELCKNLRQLMGPYTATKLRERKTNKLKDYTAVAVHLGVTHVLTLSQTKSNVILRIGKCPNGPTLHFRIKEYSLARQVLALQKRPHNASSAFTTPPLVVLNNFGGEDNKNHVKLMRATLQNMLPAINVQTVHLSNCRRVVLFHYLKDKDIVEMRQYAIVAQPVGVSRAVKKILQSKIPNLNKLSDISQFLAGEGMDGASDSEAEDENARVILPDKYHGRGNGAMQQSALKLKELGPRLSLELFKVEREVGEGDILYHKFEERTPAEAAAMKNKIEKEKMEKNQRRAEQEENVQRKRALEEEKSMRKAEKKLKRDSEKQENEESDDEGDESVDEGEDGDRSESEVSEDDDESESENSNESGY